ncbi:MAG: pyruvate-formate lyase [Defluviitaleaceae bacterium]|nr:pyruvate-formate lyase [Defluviitaleaceae bacterium]MCL2240262.1 pyruvate-formate lyase [Defluviitaleaceae bacterium]
MKPVVLSQDITGRIAALRETKKNENNKKVAQFGGAYNTDDHGFICFDDFKFTPAYPEGYEIMFGPRCIGENLKRFFAEMPVYIHPQSALAGAWAGFFNRDFVNIGLRPEDEPKHLYATHEKYGLNPGIGGMNHLGPDMEIGFRLGYPGLLEKIRHYRKKNAPAGADFYAGEEATVEGILAYIENHFHYAQKMAAEATDPWERENYTNIAQSLKNLLEGPPKTFRDVCQFLAVFQSADRTYFGGGGLQQLDELIRLYYEADVAAGILTDEEAVWMLASLFYNDTHYSQLGGQSPDGTRELTTPISFIILQAAHELAIPHNLAVRVFEGSDDKLLRRALEYIVEKGTGPCFSLSKGIEEGYMKQGHPIELARMRANVGCNWVALPGIEYPLQDVTRLNMGFVFHHALEDTMAGGDPDLDKLWANFSKHLLEAVKCIAEGYDWHYEVVSRNTPELVLNLFCHGPIERGVNCANGGVDILNLNVDGTALATVADSFAAIEQRVVIEKKLTWEEMHKTVRNNFKDAEPIRLMLKNIPRFGHPESLALPWALRIRDEFVRQVNETPTPKYNIRVVPGLFSHGEIYGYGKNLPATPNGRFDGDPISHSNEPDPGFASGVVSFSPSLKATAVAQAQPGMGNSAPLHLDVDTNMIKGAGGVDALIALVHTHNQMGGTRINLNCVTAEQILAAHENPDAYPDLVIRVTGYSAFFSSLSKDYRQQVVDRYLR